MPYFVPMTARTIDPETGVAFKQSDVEIANESGKGKQSIQDEGSTIGTIVKNFQFTAKMPNSVSSLSYVLNQNPDEISEEDIAPYVNLMYQSGTEEQQKLIEAKAKFAEDEAGNRIQLTESLKKYLQYPADAPNKSLHIMSPIFPFDVSFEIDGINGFKYGDVLSFDILPLNYRINTVFSIMSINHTIGTEGEWTTSIKCIMRPRIGV